MKNFSYSEETEESFSFSNPFSNMGNQDEEKPTRKSNKISSSEGYYSPSYTDVGSEKTEEKTQTDGAVARKVKEVILERKTPVVLASNTTKKPTVSALRAPSSVKEIEPSETTMEPPREWLAGYNSPLIK
jgi:hypothetical protein